MAGEREMSSGGTYSDRARLMVVKAAVAVAVLGFVGRASAETIEGRWKLIAAEDFRADGTVARYPWGRHPVGSIVVERGWCYIQIMSGDVPAFAPDTAPAQAMTAALASSYLAYTGPCTFDDGSVTLTVEAASRPDYPGTQQKRFYRFADGKLLFGPAPNSINAGGERLTRRLTLERP